MFQLDSNGPESAEAVPILDVERFLKEPLNSLIYIQFQHWAQLDYNWRFLVEYYATFVPLGKTPHQSVFKVRVSCYYIYILYIVL